MKKNILFKNEAIAKIVDGLDKASEAVGGTMGPKGLNVYLEDSMGLKVVNDGFTIAKEVELPDKNENAGAYAVKNIAGQQNDDVGDGTTTVVVLLQSLIHECLARPENRMLVKESLKKAGNDAIKKLSKKSVKISKDDINRVALISAENPELARLIAEIINKLGDRAVINVEDSKTLVTDYEIVDGYEAQVGYMSPHFVNDKKSGRAVFNDVPILVSEKKITNIADVAPLFEDFKKRGIGQLVMVVDEIDDSMLGMFVINNNMGTFKSLIVRATGEALKDIAGATGATPVSASTGVTFQTLKADHLGFAKKVISDASKTIFIGSGEASKAYADELERTLDNEENMWLQKRLKDRIARLRGGIAVLKIAAPSDLEREYLKLKAEDAVKAVQAALEEGIIEGGGMALWRIAQEMKPKTIGEEILKRSLTAPLKKIIENCGLDYAEVIKNLPDGQGFDARNLKYVNMIEAGIVDPTKVERCALMNAISSASTLATTFAVITEYDEPKERTN